MRQRLSSADDTVGPAAESMGRSSNIMKRLLCTPTGRKSEPSVHSWAHADRWVASLSAPTLCPHSLPSPCSLSPRLHASGPGRSAGQPKAQYDTDRARSQEILGRPQRDVRLPSPRRRLELRERRLERIIHLRTRTALSVVYAALHDTRYMCSTAASAVKKQCQ